MIFHRVVLTREGDDGEEGDRTMNPWARPSWVVAVGACNGELTAVEPWSSRGDPDDSEHRPFVLAKGYNRDQEPGTSFAAPKVAAVARSICHLLAAIARTLAIPPAVYRPRLLPTGKHVLRRLATPIAGPAHQVGHGIVSGEGFEKWLAQANAVPRERVFDCRRCSRTGYAGSPRPSSSGNRESWIFGSAVSPAQPRKGFVPGLASCRVRPPEGDGQP